MSTGNIKSFFDRKDTEEMLARVDRLDASAKAEWGLMRPNQMLAHCSLGFDMATGKINAPRHIIGRIIGRFLRKHASNDVPLQQNTPTLPELRQNPEEAGPEFSLIRQELKNKIMSFHQGGNDIVTRHPHPFFGKLRPDEWATLQYKHLDHHLRQFKG